MPPVAGGRIMPHRLALSLAVLVVLVHSQMGASCTLCPNPQSTATLRQESSQARMVLYGTMSNAKLIPGAPGGGTTDLQIEAILKSDPFLAGKNSVTIPRYVPADPKVPPRFVIFCDISGGKLYADRGIPAKTAAV